MKLNSKVSFVVVFWAVAYRALAGMFDNPNTVFEHFPNVNVDAHMLRVAEAHFSDIREGRIPVDTRELANAQTLPSLNWKTAKDAQIATWFRKTLHAWAVGGEPQKEWRISNKIDIWRWCFWRSDAFWTSQHLGARDAKMNPLIAGLRRLDPDAQYDYMVGYEKKADGSSDWYRPRYTYRIPTNSYEVLKRICAEDDCARDVIVGIGLVCKDLPLAKRAAMELAGKSEVNWPVYALRLPIEEARKVLAGHDEYAQLLSNLEIRAMEPGLGRHDAIIRHISRFPDYTEEDMPRTSIALNTYEELGAVAGYDLVCAGRYREALALWMERGGCPEDVALVAEQILTIDELKELIAKHPWRPTDVPRPRIETIWADLCSRCGGEGRYIKTISPGAVRAYVRTMLAKRLMRDGHCEEAVQYFHRSADYVLALRYQHLKKIFDKADPTSPTPRDVYCGLALGALMRQGADRLFGTEQEPDNMICRGRYPCEWAVGNAALSVARTIAERHRYHYRWRTADVYKRTGDLAGRAAGLEDQLRLQCFCYWMRSIILRYRDPRLAFEDYSFVRENAPELIGKFSRDRRKGETVTNESYQVAAKIPSPFKEWMRVDDWLRDDPFAPFTDVLPKVEPVPLPPHQETCDGLILTGEQLFDDAGKNGDFSDKGFPAALYAFYLAGQRGSAYGYVRCCAYYMHTLGDYGMAAPFLRAANKCDPTHPAVRYNVAQMKAVIGLGHEAYNEIKAIADSECPNRDIKQFVIRTMVAFSSDGFLDIKPDAELERKYRRLVDR